MKELEENITPANIGGMGPVLLPTATQVGSGDVPAGSGDAEEEYKKNKKNKKKMKKLKNFESFTSKDIVTEGRVKQFTTDLKDMIKDIKRGYGWIDPEYVEDTWENSSDSIDFELVKSEIYRQLIKAGLLAKSDDDNEEEAGEYIKSLKQLGIKESVITERKNSFKFKGRIEDLDSQIGSDYYIETTDDEDTYDVYDASTKEWVGNFHYDGKMVTLLDMPNGIFESVITEGKDDYMAKFGIAESESVDVIDEVNEAKFFRLPNKLNAMWDLKNSVDYIVGKHDAGNDYNPADMRTIEEFIKKIKQSAKSFKDAEEVKGTVYESLVNESFVAYTENSKGEYEVVKVLKDQRAAKAWRKKNAYLLDDDSVDVKSIGTTPKKDWDKTHPELATESLVNEAKSAPAKKLLTQVSKGNTSEIEGTKFSKEMADEILNWMDSSTYAKKYKEVQNASMGSLSGIIFSDAWGIKKRLPKELKAEYDTLKNVFKKEVAESLVNEAKFVKDFNRDVLKAKTKEEVLELYPNAEFFTGKSDHFFGELDGNLFFKAYYTKAQKEFEIKSVYSEKGSNYVHLYNESVVNEAKFDKSKLLRALGKNHDGEILVNGKTYIIYNPDSGNDDNAAMWNDKSIFAVDQDGEEYEFKYSEIERFNESVVNEAAQKSAGLVQFAADEKAEGKNAEIHLAFFDGSGMEAQSTNKTWDDGVPVTKNFTRGGYKRIAPKGEIYIIESNDWWYFKDKGTWYAVKRKDYGTPPFEY